MKIYTLKFRKIDKHNFNEIKSGLKIIETRAATEKYQSMEVGDDLIFNCGKDSFSKKIINKQHFKNIDEMVKKIPFNKIMPKVSSIEEMKKVYSSYSNYDEKIKEFGILAFELS